jgi:hypothetical protein
MLGAIEYKLSNMEAAKRELELCAKTADPKYTNMTQVWAGLETTSRALGLLLDAENYRKLRTELPPKSKIN